MSRPCICGCGTLLPDFALVCREQWQRTPVQFIRTFSHASGIYERRRAAKEILRAARKHRKEVAA